MNVKDRRTHHLSVMNKQDLSVKVWKPLTHWDTHHLWCDMLSDGRWVSTLSLRQRDKLAANDPVKMAAWRERVVQRERERETESHWGSTMSQQEAESAGGINNKERRRRDSERRRAMEWSVRQSLTSMSELILINCVIKSWDESVTSGSWSLKLKDHSNPKMSFQASSPPPECC